MNELVEDIDQQILTLKNDLNSAIYTYLVGLHSSLEKTTSTETANDVVLTVLSMNIGHIIGQLPADAQFASIKHVYEIINNQVTEVSKLNDAEYFGMIGHA
jgi:hypothetical protein